MSSRITRWLRQMMADEPAALVNEELASAKEELLKAQSQVEYFSAIVSYNKKRIARLEALQNAPADNWSASWVMTSQTSPQKTSNFSGTLLSAQRPSRSPRARPAIASSVGSGADD